MVIKRGNNNYGGDAMQEEQFKKRMAILAAMVGNDQTADLFNQSYEELLNEVKVQSEPRFHMLLKMKKMSMIQGAYLLNSLQGKAPNDPHTPTMMQ
jgi:hypothetical protein